MAFRYTTTYKAVTVVGVVLMVAVAAAIFLGSVYLVVVLCGTGFADVVPGRVEDVLSRYFLFPMVGLGGTALAFTLVSLAVMPMVDLLPYLNVAVVLTRSGLVVIRPHRRRSYSWGECSRVEENGLTWWSYRLLDTNNETVLVLGADDPSFSALRVVIDSRLQDLQPAPSVTASARRRRNRGRGRRT